MIPPQQEIISVFGRPDLPDKSTVSRGGEVLGTPLLRITWQTGVIPDVGVNGCLLETALDVCIGRLRWLNEQFPCRENSLAITNLEQARLWLLARTLDREARGVEGKREA